MPKFNELSALLLKEAVDSGITSIPELTSLMANASVETWHFTTMHERLSYSSVQNVIDAVSSADNRFTIAQIQAAIDSKDPTQIATILYEGRSRAKDLGNTEPGDGAKYYGRGYFQYTGRIRYATYGEKFGVDLVNNPDQAAEPKLAAKLAIAYWREKVSEENRTDARLAGEDINGGTNGAMERAAAQVQWARTITSDLVKDIETGQISLDQLSFHGWEPLKDGKLNRNERGMEVRELQHHLNDLGIADAKGRRLDPNGTFDTPTQQAVETFQRQLGMPAKSAVTADTLKAAAFYANAPEILRKPLQPMRESILPDSLYEPNPIPPGAPPSYRTEWLERDAKGLPNYLHTSAAPAPHSAVAPGTDPTQALLMQLQTEMDALRRQVQQQHAPSQYDAASSYTAPVHTDPGYRPPQSHLGAGYPHEAPAAASKPAAHLSYDDPRHPDHALFDVIRKQLPPGTSDDMAAHATLEAKKGGIVRPDQIRGMAVEDGRLTVMGKTGLDFAVVELTASAPPLQETLEQSAAFDRQQTIQLAQFREQQQQLNMSRGPSMTL